MPTAEAFIGIDVARDKLDLAVRPAGQHWQVANTATGITALLPQLRALAPTLIVLEATGGLELPLLAELGSAGLPAAAVNPRQVRDFAKAVGKLAKTDAIDAQVLAHFADAVRPVVRPLPDAATQALGALVTRRRQLVEMLTAEENRLKTATPAIRADIQEHIVWLRKRLKDIDKSSAKPYAPARCGENRKPCSGVCRVLVQWSVSPCWLICPNLALLAASRLRRWSDWRHSIATAAPCAANGLSGVGGLPYVRPCIWEPWLAVDTTPSSVAYTHVL